jgi:hypothetical protein
VGGRRDDGRQERPRLSRRQVFRLILATYATSLPYVVLFVVVMLLVTWVMTTFLR